MKLEVIDNHSVVVGLLTKGAVLDAGCRGFRFAKWFAERGHEVVALDPSPDIQDPMIPNITFGNVALAFPSEQKYLVMTEDPEARYLTNSLVKGQQSMAVRQTWLDHAKSWDVVKLNIEGSEFEILKNWPGPIARQIVASFHQHCHYARRTEKEIAGALTHLERWYKVFNHVKEKRYGCSENYWDTVFIRRDLT